MPKESVGRTHKTKKSSGKKTTGSRKIIYLDNNATTIICPEAEAAYKKWIKCYNPSSASRVSQGAKSMMDSVRNAILAHCGTDSNIYTVIFTSGATESNCFILRSCAESYRKIRQTKPHIIISSIEHHSIMECAAALEDSGYADITRISPNMYGCILADDVAKCIKPTTCLISIMYANNEVGSINNIQRIGELAHEHKIPMHTDAVQIFGKYPIVLEKNNIDAMSVSFHKLYGPKGIGLMILKNELIKGYELKGQICGSQEQGLRGGTENLPAIASGFEAMKCNFRNRKAKNRRLLKMREFMLDKLSSSDLIKPGVYSEYLNEKFVSALKNAELVILGPPREKISHYLPNTVLLSIAKPGKEFCNVKFKEDLDKVGIVVSITSACLTSSETASHVLTAMGAPKIIKRGVLRISMGDTNTMDEIKTFVKRFFELLQVHLAD